MGRNTSKCKGGHIISAIQVHSFSKCSGLNDMKTRQERVVMLSCLQLWLMQANKHIDNLPSGTFVDSLMLLLTPLATQKTKSLDTCTRSDYTKKRICKDEPRQRRKNEHNPTQNCKLQQSERKSEANNSNVKQDVHLEYHKTEALQTSFKANKTIVHNSSNNGSDSNETQSKTNNVTSSTFNLKTNKYEFDSSSDPAVGECKHRHDTCGSYKKDTDVLVNDYQPLNKLFDFELEASKSIYTAYPVFTHVSKSAIRAAGVTTQTFDPLMSIINRISDGERVPPQISMRYEMLRFCTLRSFPRENKPYITRLAEAGFYYANNGDEVVCYCCARRKSNWRETDSPIDVHKQLNPNCSFLLHNSEVNVPIKCQNQGRNADIPESEPCQNNNRVSGSETENNIGPILTDESSRSSTANVKQSYTVKVQTTYTRLPQMTGENDSSSAITGSHNPTLSPKYPAYSSKTIRLASFCDCGNIVVAPGSLAEAGFFYVGYGDCVRCFHCGVGLRHWSEEDDPWIEHSRWSKECSYVQEIKGSEFVNLVQMAVQYSQNQQSEEQPLSVEAGASAANVTETEGLLQTDAAQSVLEMGYNPDIIRTAIRLVLASNDKKKISAVSLMEKIFEIEEDDTDKISSRIGRSNNRQKQAFSEETSKRNSARMKVLDKQESVGTVNNYDEPLNSCIAAGRETSTRICKSKDSPELSTIQTGEQENATSTSENREPSAHSSDSSKVHSSSMFTGKGKAKLQEQKRLKEENQKLKQQSICTKCRRNDVCIVFLPCGHLVTCEECAPTVRYCTLDSCGKYIKGTVRTYLA